MKIIPNAANVALKSLSLWANRAGFASLLVAGLWPDADPLLFGWAGVVLYVLAELLRYLDQGGLDGDRRTFWSAPWVALLVAALFVLPAMGEVQQKPAPDPVAQTPTEAETFEILLPFLERWEGVRLVAYQDIVGVWTICMGETRGVQPNDTLTIDDCRAHTREMAREYRAALHGHFTHETLAYRLTPARDAALTSLTINIGQGAAGRSTAVSRLNGGDIAGACRAIRWWNKAGQRIVRGLVLRRQAEFDLCMAGLA